MSTISVDELIQRIAAAYDSLPKQLKSVATYIEQHRYSVMVDRVSDIAKHCNVHASAVVRFAQSFGFSGFSDMQEVFRAAYTQQAAPTQNYQQRIRNLIGGKAKNASVADVGREFIDGSRSGLDELAASFDPAGFEAAVELLLKAKTIYVVGVRRSFTSASYLVYALQHTTKHVVLVNGLGGMYRDQVGNIAKGDLLVAITFLPYGRETQVCARIARNHHASTLVITDSQLSPLARHATALLTVKEGSIFGFRSLTNTMCLCQALFIAMAYKLELTIEEPQPNRPIEEHD
ncbi:MAG TPA: MurR/RpiR family transcriptional regulator [Chthoniobacterales bacterium]